ncbi:MAG: hypothetical protein AAF533_24035 [Acidobacteriota bacterium]
MRALPLRLPVLALLALASLVIPRAAFAQGRDAYFNVETPQVHPIELIEIAGVHYLAVVNTPDNSVELYLTDESLPPASRFLDRVPVGFEPGSCRWIEELGQLMVTNFLGDSLTAIAIEAPTGPASFSATPVQTIPVTDEPMDVLYLEVPDPNAPDGEEPELVPALMVTHATLDAVGLYDANTLLALEPGSGRRDASLSSGQDLDGDGAVDDIAVKQPWTLATCDPGDGSERVLVLGHLGGNTMFHDLDLYSEDPGGGNPGALAGLGAVNWNMTFGADGTLYVVGAQHLNGSRFGESTVATAPTGFTESTIWAIENPCSDMPIVHRRDVNERLTGLIAQPRGPVVAPGPSGPGGALPGGVGGLATGDDPETDLDRLRRDGRRSSDRRSTADDSDFGTMAHVGDETTTPELPETNQAGGVVIGPPVLHQIPGPFPKDEALAQLTDVVVFERPTANWPKVFFTALSSDRIGIVVPRLNQDPLRWPRRFIDLGPALGGSPIRGPRGLALRQATDFDDGRLYVLSRFDNSITIINPTTETVIDSFELQAHPVDPWILDGREPLYSAKRSGNGFVSCSSCHVDGRTDGLGWDLSDGMAATIPPELNSTPALEWPADKEFMVTQTLQGLLNWEVEPEAQSLFTNAPYHWRGDRATFLNFAGAFVSLLGGDPISNDDMVAYEEFINSIHYPPNPKQPLSRNYSGSVGNPQDGVDFPDFELSGEDALKGLKVFHTINSGDGVSCVHCHSLPEGSNNILTEVIGGHNPHPIPAALSTPQPIETAAMRMLFQRESRLDRDGSSIPRDSPITGYEGLTHTGLILGSANHPANDANAVASINAFNLNFFDAALCGPPLPPFCGNMSTVNQFSHEMDTGTGPLAGKGITVNLANLGNPGIIPGLLSAEDQAKAANSGVAVNGIISGVRRSWWYDVTEPVPVYREEPSGTAFTGVALISLLVLPEDRLTFTATPLGSERRFGHPDGDPNALPGPAPDNLRMLPMVLNTANADVPSFGSTGWIPPLAVLQFGHHSHTIRLYQNAILDDGPADGWGLCSVRHDAPRKFCVSGSNIRHGARMRLRVVTDRSFGPLNPDLPIDDPSQPPTTEIVLPLHGTDLLIGDDPVFETAVEMEPQYFFALMAGAPGPASPLDQITGFDFMPQFDPESQPGLFNPIRWNNHWMEVENEDGTLGRAGYVQLRIAPGPDCP